MGIIKSASKKGKIRITVRKHWPDGTELVRTVANRAVGEKLLSRINEAIAMGTWRDLKDELKRGVKKDVTVQEFWETFRDKYCKLRVSSWKRYELSFKTINDKVGSVSMREFTRSHLNSYIESRKGVVADSTINRDISAIKKMFNFAEQEGVIERNPLVRYETIPVQETALRILTIEEFERLIDSMPTPEMAAFIAITGETGARKGEALRLKWKDVNFKLKHITFSNTKGKTVRSVPLSEKALQAIAALPRRIGVDNLFIRESGQNRGKRIKNPYEQFNFGRKAAGLEWVTIHGLRHFRGTSWLQRGADIVTVQKKLGHKNIKTTMRYLHYIETHGDKVIRMAQEQEMNERFAKDISALARVKNGSGY